MPYLLKIRLDKTPFLKSKVLTIDANLLIDVEREKKVKMSSEVIQKNAKKYLEPCQTYRVELF